MNRKGFTLIELLVEAIIGILAAVGVVVITVIQLVQKNLLQRQTKNVIKWLSAEAQKCQMV